MSEEKNVLYSTSGPVAIITLNRPDAMNAFNDPMRRELDAAQAQAENDSEIRVVLLQGSGRAFSSGTDLKETMEAKPPLFDISVTEYKPIVDAIENSDKIYLTSVNGIAGGVSLAMLLGSDLSIMSDQASVFSPFANIGLVPDGGTSWYFLRYLGRKKAFEAIAECTHLSAETCLELGMVNRVVPHDKLADESVLWAQSLAARAPLSLKFTKRLLRAAASQSREDTARMESEFQNICARSEDAEAGIRAFVTKTKPVFKGR